MEISAKRGKPQSDGKSHPRPDIRGSKPFICKKNLVSGMSRILPDGDGIRRQKLMPPDLKRADSRLNKETVDRASRECTCSQADTIMVNRV